jgi:type VI secretion system protein ImpH
VKPLSPAILALRERVRAAVMHVGLFPLVRQLERALARDAPVGGDLPADREKIHFTHPPDFTFPAGDVVDLAFQTHGDRVAATLTTRFLGLLGTESPLAPAMSEEVLFEDEPEGLSAFFNVFQHRAVALLYRAWRRYSVAATFDGVGEDAFGPALLSLVGIDAFSSEAAPRATEPMFALGLSDFSRCEPTYLDLASLEQILGMAFPDLMPRVSQSAPRFVVARTDEVSRLGEWRSTLGVDAAYGAGALDADGLLRILVGPVDRETYEELMPGGARYRAMQPLVDEWLVARTVAELEVVLASEVAPRATLGEAFGGTLGVDARYSSRDEAHVRVRVLLLAEPTMATRTYVE